MVESWKECVQCQLWLMKECLRGGCFDRPGLVWGGSTKSGLRVQSPENLEKSSAKAKNTSLQFHYIYFLAMLLEDNNGGLEVHHQNRWFDLLPMQELLQSRTSVACFVHPFAESKLKTYGIMKELLSDGSLIAAFMACVKSRGVDSASALSHFKLA
ncbi:hypothetical protein SADUNF_Sadunf17G0125500 [Salix dunnii]|uniref:Uncharacterized protein n=1 Tax=Salix dunnii TaxID=1413687 RepID=A0A835J825_9ROSI|nr:hypothetical protein SADUNF_Sadunf17G0125500 [Salix dunnii]